MPSSISTVFANRRSTMHHIAGLSFLAATLAFVAPATMLAAPATSTTLALTNLSNVAETSVAQSTPIALTALVQLPGRTNLTSGGTVEFFDSGALIGSAQVIKTGASVSNAILRLVPGAGAHSYTAQFMGTTAGASSVSTAGGVTAKALTVTTTGHAYKDSSVQTAAGGPHGSNGYTITDVVTFLGAATPSGTVAFEDSSRFNTINTASFTFAGALVPQPTSAAGSSPLIATAGDFNEDGYPDLVYTSSPASGATSAGVSISLNNKNGTFATPSAALAAGNYPITLAVGDFNNDGHLDLAVANLGDGTVSILAGLGNGTFGAALAPIQVGLDPFTLTVGDFNNDGKLDLATANLGSGTVTVLLGVGDATFTAGATLTVGQAPDAIAVADFDKDGNTDLAVANLNDGTVSIFYGNGSGTSFVTGPVVSAGTFPASIVVADFNGDTFPDIAVANQNVSGTVTVLSGAAGRTFSTAPGLAVGNQPYGIVAGNLLGNGHIDLAVANLGNISVLPGQAGGTFAAQQLINSGLFGSLTTLAVADFNGDGSLDFVAPNYDLGTTNFLAGARIGTAVSAVYTFNNTPTNHTITATYNRGTTDAYPSTTAANITVAR